MTYQIEKQHDDGTWSVYRNGQQFRSTNGARCLFNRLADRYGIDRVRMIGIDALGIRRVVS